MAAIITSWFILCTFQQWLVLLYKAEGKH